MRYARRDLRPGDTFIAPDVDAGYLVRTGRASVAVVAPEPRQTPQRGRPPLRGRVVLTHPNPPETPQTPEPELGEGDDA